MSSPPSESTQRPLLSRLVQAIFSSADDNNVMMAAIVSLVVVVLFVLILHLYARSSFHSRSLRRHSRRRRRSPNSESQIPPIPISSFVLDLAARSAKGLEASAIAAIPLFVSGGDESECVVCLSVFDGGEIGRRLPKCGHEFHVECIDMWLQSHSNCPICRAPVMAIQENNTSASSDLSEIVEIADRGDSRVGEEGGDGFLVIEIDGNNNESSAEIHGSSEIGCSSSSSFGSSLKRMLSRNRSERKVSPVNIAESTG